MGATRRSGVVVGSVLIGGVLAGLTIPVWLRLAPAGTPVGVVLVIAVVSWTIIAALVVLVVERDATRVAARLAGDRERQQQLFWRRGLPFSVDPQDFEGLVDDAVAGLPVWVRDALGDRRVLVASEDQREGEPWVLGLYQTRPVVGGPLAWGGQTIDVDRLIVLYRAPLIRQAGSPDRLVAVVRETLLHEVGHALGMSEEDLNRYSIGNQPRPDAIPLRRS
jgi:predicted Zn-dependent protease with MMP-like domain